ncbi:MAG: type I methionyl aminopeptidase [Terriglobia bacterium]
MIICKSSVEIEKLRRSGRMVRQVLGEMRELVRPGITTLDLEKFVVKRLKELGTRPAFKGYRGYPCCLCASVNDEVIHGIPSERRTLREGDILSLDMGVVQDGYYGDSAITVPVGAISEDAQRLLRITEEALELALDKVRLGNRLGDVSATVQQYAEKNGYSVVREFVGHGIGKAMHEEPQVPNYGQAGHGPLLKQGMVFAVEPMVNAGGPAVRVLGDNWTAVTVDGKLSAHFEHMVAVTQNGPDVLTRL